MKASSRNSTKSLTIRKLDLRHAFLIAWSIWSWNRFLSWNSREDISEADANRIIDQIEGARDSVCSTEMNTSAQKETPPSAQEADSSKRRKLKSRCWPGGYLIAAPRPAASVIAGVIWWSRLFWLKLQQSWTSAKIKPPVQEAFFNNSHRSPIKYY